MAVKKRTKEGFVTATIAPGEIVPAAEVDERLFLLRRLERFYEYQLGDFSDLDALETSFGEFRKRVHRYHDYVKDRDLDPRLTSLYAELNSAAESCEAFVATVRKILKEAETSMEGDSSASDLIPAVGDSWLGLAAGVGVSMWKSYKSAKSVGAAAQHAIQEAAREPEKKFSEALAHAQNAAILLSEKYGWRRGEAGFDLPPEQEERLAKLGEEGDFKGMLSLLDMIHRRRPRDPFAAVTRHLIAARVQILSDDCKASELVALAEGCVAAASLVPAGYMYDEDRGYCLFCGAFILTQGAFKECDNEAWGATGSRLPAQAVALWEARDLYVPFDPDTSGEGRQYRAAALAMNGDFEKALGVAAEVEELRKEDLLYAYLMAGLMNHLGRTDESFTWFEHAVRKLGYNDFKEVEKDENLRAMRKANRDKYDALAEVKIALKISFGFFNDDIVITNKSAFPITNVKLKGEVVAASGGPPAKRESFDLSAEQLAAWTPNMSDLSDTHTWSNVISVPGSRIDTKKTKLTFSCDQLEETWEIRFTNPEATKAEIFT